MYVFMIRPDMVVKLISQLSNAFMSKKIKRIKWLHFVNGEYDNLVNSFKVKVQMLIKTDNI